MSTTRACRACQMSHLRCDLQRPVCGACAKRGISCSGWTPESQYRFRQQNETAKRNSERAHRSTVRTGKRVEMAVMWPELATSQSQDHTALIDRKAMPWLKEQALASISMSPRSSIEDKARAIFYSEWILHPSNHGVNPGYLHVLPEMEAQASSTSALHLSVEALTLANIGSYTVRGGNLKIMAEIKYGEALAAMRSEITERQHETDDSTLLAVLTIDMFEGLFTDREEPLGLHSTAIEHLLTARGKLNISSYSGFCLYRMAQHRLQSRQLMLGLDPLPVQRECIDVLNMSDPALCLSEHLLKVQQLVALSQRLPSAEPSSSPDTEKEALMLIWRIRSVLDELEQWSENVPALWQPRYLQGAEYDRVQETLQAASLLPIPQIRLYYDPWIAYQMNFFYQGQLSLRSALVDILTWTAEMTPDAGRSGTLRQQAEAQTAMVSRLADILVESIPALIGLIDSAQMRTNTVDCHRGRKISRYFVYGACWTLQHGKHVSVGHKEFATRAIEMLHEAMGRDSP